MECKAEPLSPNADSTSLDLIETLWNVKVYGRVSRIGIAAGFNRDIVECKGKPLAKWTWLYIDLIETLWNVKIFHFCNKNSERA